jgi:hypothetical protein
VGSVTELCGLRVHVKTYIAPKGSQQCRRCQRFGHTHPNCGYAHSTSLAETNTGQVRVRSQFSSLNAAAARAITLTTIAVAVSGRRKVRLLQRACKGSTARMIESRRASRNPNRLQTHLRTGRSGDRLEPRGARLPRREGLGHERTHPQSIRRGYADQGSDCPRRGPAQTRSSPGAGSGFSGTVAQAHWLLSHPTTESVTTRGDHRPLRQTSDLGHRRFDTLSVLHGLIPPNSERSPASRPQNRHSILGLAWRHSLGELGVKPSGWRGRTLTVSAAGSLTTNSSSVRTALIFASTRPTLWRSGP